MSARVYASGKSGEIDLEDGKVFRWGIETNNPPEIYAWVEEYHDIVPKTGGCWRTADPDEACRLCCAAFGFKRKEDE